MKGSMKMEFVKFIIENALILVPALYVIGLILNPSSYLKYIKEQDYSCSFIHSYLLVSIVD